MNLKMQYTNGTFEIIDMRNILQYDINTETQRICEGGVGGSFDYIMKSFVEGKPLVILEDSKGFATEGLVEKRGRRLINLLHIKDILEVEEKS